MQHPTLTTTRPGQNIGRLARYCTLSLFVAMAGCGGGGGSSTPGATPAPPTNTAPPVTTPPVTTPPDSSAPTVVSGVVAIGPVAGATVTVTSLAADSTRGSVLGTTTTDTVGRYSVHLGAYRGVVQVTAMGGTYADPATGTVTALTVPLRSAHGLASGATTVQVTPFTEAIFSLLMLRAPTVQSPVTIETLGTAASTARRIVGFDVMTTTPVDSSKTPTSGTPPEGRLYGNHLGALAQMWAALPATSGGAGVEFLRNALNDLSGYRMWGNANGRSSYFDAANAFAINPKNKLNTPTAAPVLLPEIPADVAELAKNPDDVWSGTWTCPATITRFVYPCDLPNAHFSCSKGSPSNRSFNTFKVADMWCMQEGTHGATTAPVRAMPSSAAKDTRRDKQLLCPASTDLGWWVLQNNDWCVFQPYTDPSSQATLARYTPAPDEPMSLRHANQTLSCAPDKVYPSEMPYFLQGSWCLPPGMPLPKPAVFNQCESGYLWNGTCAFASAMYAGQRPYGPTKPIDMTVGVPFDAADTDRFTYTDITFTCPAGPYSPQPYTATGGAFGAPKPPFTVASPCLSASKAYNSTMCGGSDFAATARTYAAEASYLRCLATNSDEPFKTGYAGAAQYAQDSADQLYNACPYGQVKRDGVCVVIPPSTPTPIPGGSSSSQAAACANEYSGPNDDIQVDAHCKLAAFDACLRRTTGQSTYDFEGRNACSTLKSLLETLGATQTYTCKYCPYPY